MTSKASEIDLVVPLLYLTETALVNQSAVILVRHVCENAVIIEPPIL